VKHALENRSPEIYKELLEIARDLVYEKRWNPQEIEFTFEGPKASDLYILQTRDMITIKKKERFNVFGNNYNTQDGTCVRDYIHVTDIAQAHILALAYLQNNGQSDFFNLGSQNGYTVMQVIRTAEKVCNKKALLNICDRRPGDVDILLANAKKAHKIFEWKPINSDLKTILQSAYDWEVKKEKILVQTPLDKTSLNKVSKDVENEYTTHI